MMMVLRVCSLLFFRDVFIRDFLLLCFRDNKETLDLEETDTFPPQSPPHLIPLVPFGRDVEMHTRVDVDVNVYIYIMNHVCVCARARK
jgi:hypothetical protein